MCGIAGLCRLDGQELDPAALQAVKAMTDAMTYRGPDGEGQWLAGPICLGHRRLSIIDLAGGVQPMASADGRCCIVFNGEIYNFQELKKKLAAAGAIFRTNSDTETILAAWEAWGVDCLQQIEGMFAFALWDAKKKTLFCARDHFGKKPFFYSIQNGIFAFASELGSLALLERQKSMPQFQFHLDPYAVMRYLAYEYVPVPQTIYREAAALEPAHYLLLKNGELKISRYWDLPAPETKMPGSEQETCARLYELMSRAVRLRMISDVPLGVFLSGGIDSSIVAGLMASQSQRPIETFSIGFSEASYDESSYARLVAKAYGTNHHERILSAEACADELPGIVGSMDTPMADASCAPTWLLSALTRENVTVALGGDGSDELWAGYEHYIGYHIAQCYNRAPGILRDRLIPAIANLLPQSAGYINLRLAVRTFLKGAAAPDWLRVQTMLTALSPEMQRELLAPQWLEKYGSDFLDNENIFAPTKKQFEHWIDSPGATPLARAFHVYARQFLLDDILVKVDRCSMLHSLEVRAPFLDRNVAEFTARLPVSCKLHGFKRKYLLKKTFASLLPREIVKRNKRGFQIPVAAWLRGKLKPLLLDLLDEKKLREQGIFEPAAVHRLIDSHLQNESDMRKPLWTLLVLQIWLRANRAVL